MPFSSHHIIWYQCDDAILTGDVDLDLLVKVVSARFLQCEVAVLL